MHTQGRCCCQAGRRRSQTLLQQARFIQRANNESGLNATDSSIGFIRAGFARLTQKTAQCNSPAQPWVIARDLGCVGMVAYTHVWYVGWGKPVAISMQSSLSTSHAPPRPLLPLYVDRSKLQIFGVCVRMCVGERVCLCMVIIQHHHHRQCLIHT